MSSTAILAQPEFDPSWSIFDQDSIRIASESYYQQDALDGGSSLGDSTTTSDFSMDHQQQQGYGNSELWSSYGNQMGSWPSNLTRVFGHAAFQEMKDDGNSLQ
jgi:hypothetical protein